MKRTPLKRKPWRKALGDSAQRFSFKRDVILLDRGCVMAGVSDCEGDLQAAHVIRKATLRRMGFGAEAVYSPDAALCLCERHHNRHDRGLDTVPYDLLPARCKLFVQMFGLSHLLERTYQEMWP